MNNELEQFLIKKGASMVGFAKLNDLYAKVDLDAPRSEDSVTEAFDIPQYPIGISIVLAYPNEIIKNISKEPNMDYYDAYHELNQQLDEMTNMCAEYIEKAGYHAYAQTTSVVKEFGIFRTIMPHKTVAVNAGLGWIGKSALFVTEPYGSAVRLTSVLTDAPLTTGKPTLKSKCGKCMRCTDACPGKAVSGRLWNPENDRDDFFDANACRKKAREIAAKTLHKEITLCGKCIEVCPYTRKYTMQ
jgi:Uncharacterized Fe-S protein